MISHNTYWQEVALKYQVYNGLFLGLPFPDVHRAGILLPVFVERARALLREGRSPREIVDAFFEDQSIGDDPADRLAILFRFVQLVERQVVLFDALEDAAFSRVIDIDGAGSLNETIARIVQAERLSELAREAEQFRVRVVLTAHPTQFYPSRVLGIITDLASALAENDVPRIYDYLLQLSKTRFGNREKPSPMDEARSLLWYLENVFYDTFPSVHSRVAQRARTDRRDALRLPPVVDLGFWPGGDRDGNPFVTADTTRAVAEMLRTAVINRYIDDIADLRRRLTFDGALERLEAIEERLRATLQAGADVGSPGYRSDDELNEDLIDLWEHLEKAHQGLFSADLERLIWRARVFGFHFATLDLRQDSRVNARAVNHLFPAIAAETDVAARFLALETSLKGAPLPTPETVDETLQDPVLHDTVASLRVAREIQRSGGQRALHRSIISNTRSAANVLEVLLLARCAGYAAGNIDLDIVPLFETVNDLEHATETMTQLYESSVYRGHLRHRGNRQQIMLGFSDGTKDGGYVTANWMIYRTRERLAHHAAGYGVSVVFFEGRGGPPARGGGKTHQFYRGMNRISAGEEIHLTIQGQTISSNFGTPDIARYNLEQLVTAGLETRLLAEDYTALTEEQRDLLEDLSARSLAHYRALKDHPDFLEYLADMTPLRYYGEANNASRPTSRGSGDSLRLEDLRAIPFVGAWSQMKQNVPGYYGFGTALHDLIDAGRGSELRRMFRDHLFFRTLVENSMQSISKVNVDLTRYLSDDPRFGEIWRLVADELERTRAALLYVADAEAMLPNDTRARESIGMRESIVLPVLVIQQYALARLREEQLDEDTAASIRKLIVKSMAAIVNAGRNAV